MGRLSHLAFCNPGFRERQSTETALPAPSPNNEGQVSVSNCLGGWTALNPGWFCCRPEVTRLFPLAVNIRSLLLRRCKHTALLPWERAASTRLYWKATWKYFVIQGDVKAWIGSSKTSAMSSCPMMSFPTSNSLHLKSGLLCNAFYQLSVACPPNQKNCFLQKTHNVDHGFWLIDPYILYAWMHAIIYE